jgi:hypothetical protein
MLEHARQILWGRCRGHPCPLGKSQSTPCIIIIEKTDSEPVVTCRRTTVISGSSPSSFNAKASRTPVRVVLVDSGEEMSRTRSSVDCAFARRFRTSGQTCSTSSTLDSSQAGSDVVALAPNSAATSRNAKFRSVERNKLARLQFKQGRNLPCKESRAACRHC